MDRYLVDDTVTRHIVGDVSVNPVRHRDALLVEGHGCEVFAALGPSAPDGGGYGGRVVFDPNGGFAPVVDVIKEVAFDDERVDVDAPGVEAGLSSMLSMTSLPSSLR